MAILDWLLDAINDFGTPTPERRYQKEFRRVSQADLDSLRVEADEAVARYGRAESGGADASFPARLPDPVGRILRNHDSIVVSDDNVPLSRDDVRELRFNSVDYIAFGHASGEVPGLYATDCDTQSDAVVFLHTGPDGEVIDVEPEADSVVRFLVLHALVGRRDEATP